jgi:hypothetical protein
MLMRPPENGLYPLNAGGGCFAATGEVVRNCRCRPPTQALKGFYKDMNSRGWKVWLDATLKVLHPPVGA